MNKIKRKPDLNVDLIGGEPPTQAEKQLLSAFFREQKAKRKSRSKPETSKKKPVSG